MKLGAHLFSLGLLVALPGAAQAQSDASDLAKKLSNPISSLISVPFQLNYDSGLGVDGNGHRTLLNIQPVIPFSLSDDWNLISRTIIPLIDQSDVVPGTSTSGMGDIVQSFFFSPARPTAGGVIWGVGPVFQFPTGADGLTTDQFAAGITGVVLKQSGPWTYGALANHLWSVGDTSDGTDISATFFQPFVSYALPGAVTISLNTETIYDWETNHASVPVNLSVSKVTRIGKQPVSISGGVGYWADSPAGGPEGWRARLSFTLLFPK